MLFELDNGESQTRLRKLSLIPSEGIKRRAALLHDVFAIRWGRGRSDVGSADYYSLQTQKCDIMADEG